MGTDQANWWLAAGLAQTLGGLMLLDANDPFLLLMWGIALLISGCATIVVAGGVLLRIWR